MTNKTSTVDDLQRRAYYQIFEHKCDKRRQLKSLEVLDLLFLLF